MDELADLSAMKGSTAGVTEVLRFLKHHDARYGSVRAWGSCNGGNLGIKRTHLGEAASGLVSVGRLGWLWVLPSGQQQPVQQCAAPRSEAAAPRALRSSDTSEAIYGTWRGEWGAVSSASSHNLTTRPHLTDHAR